jgi:hypothetical protein
MLISYFLPLISLFVMSLIAICSDSHDNIPNIKKFLDWCREHHVDFVIHCGDVTEDETKKFFQENFAGEIHFVPGNADIPEQKKVKSTNRFQKIKSAPVPYLDLTLDGVAIAACHEKSKAVRLVNAGKYLFVFYGHTHRPWPELIGKTYLINPGNLAGMFYPASFALFDTKTRKLELKILN